MATSVKNIYAFIDSQNLNLGVKKDVYDWNNVKIYTGWKLDFKKFYFYLKTKYKVTKSIIFIGKVPGNESLYRYLTSIGYEIEFRRQEIKIKDLVSTGNGSKLWSPMRMED